MITDYTVVRVEGDNLKFKRENFRVENVELPYVIPFSLLPFQLSIFNYQFNPWCFPPGHFWTLKSNPAGRAWRSLPLR